MIEDELGRNKPENDKILSYLLLSLLSDKDIKTIFLYTVVTCKFDI